MLDNRFVPWWGDDVMPHVPPHPSRLRAFIYGCAQVAFDDALMLAGAKQQTVKPGLKQRQP